MKPGFTIIEALLVGGIILILASIVVVAIDPAKQLERGRQENAKMLEPNTSIFEEL